MKPQDILFILILLALTYKRNSKILAIAGFICLGLAIPLFASWTFFTAERLTWYAASFFLISIVIQLWNKR